MHYKRILITYKFSGGTLKPLKTYNWRKPQDLNGQSCILFQGCAMHYL